jgi:hypothetical protein
MRPYRSRRWPSGTSSTSPPNPHFSPRVCMGGASAPPLQGLPDYSCVPCPAQSVSRRTARGTGPTEGGSRDFGGAEAPPFRHPIRPSKRGGNSGLSARTAEKMRTRWANVRCQPGADLQATVVRVFTLSSRKTGTGCLLLGDSSCYPPLGRCPSMCPRPCCGISSNVFF